MTLPALFVRTISTLGRFGFVEHDEGGITVFASACSDWIAARWVASLFCSSVRLDSAVCSPCTSEAVNASRSFCSWTSALTGGAVVPPPNRLSNAFTGFFSGSIGVPFQNSIPFASRPLVMCEQAPRISGLTFSAFAITCSTLVRGGGRVGGRHARQAVDDARMRVRGAGVLEPLVDVHVLLVRLQRAQDADVGLVQREVGVVGRDQRVRVGDLGIEVLGRGPVRDVHQEEPLGRGAGRRGRHPGQARGRGHRHAEGHGFQEHAAVDCFRRAGRFGASPT